MYPHLVFSATTREPYFILDKPAGLPSAPRNAGDTALSAVSWLAERFPAITAVQGMREYEYGLLHRLDTATRGLLLVAATQESFDALCLAQRRGIFIKEYSAFCTTCSNAQLPGFPPAPIPADAHGAAGLRLPYIIESRFRPYGPRGSQVRPVDSGTGGYAAKKAAAPVYATELVSLHKEGAVYAAVCRIARGFRHQVRCHLAWIGFPVIGDTVYNACAQKQEPRALQFFATKLQFPHPVTGKERIYAIDAHYVASGAAFSASGGGSQYRRH
ncbi:MAG TPA: hypothetical protein IAA30_06295 [Candidatus Treponema faecavium]|nr:hypothetical protein [Candidatus Treponema faecavium]